MIFKVNIVVKIFLVLIALAIPGISFLELISDSQNIVFNLFLFIASLGFSLVSFSLGMSYHINAKSDGLHSEICFGITNIFCIFNRKDTLKWKDIEHVYSIFPFWFPLRTIIIQGFNENVYQAFLGGWFISKNRQLLTIIFDNCSEKIFDDDALKLIKK